MSDRSNNNPRSIFGGRGPRQESASDSENEKEATTPTRVSASQTQEKQDDDNQGEEPSELNPRAVLVDQDAALQAAIGFELNRGTATGYRGHSPAAIEDTRRQSFSRPWTNQDAVSPGPTIIIGAPLGHNLSAIEAADALVQQWERIYQENLLDHGEEEVQGIAEQLAQARRDRAELDTVEDRAYVEGSLQDTEGFRNKLVAERIMTLQSALESSECHGEIVNIQAAIRCYRQGVIRPSRYFALIYAGHFVDVAPSYGFFTHDRAERLSRYAAEYGPGWLWFEPPLDGCSSVSGGGGINALKSTWAMETDNAFGMGEYFITMGFKRINDINYRKPQEKEDAKRKAPRKTAQSWRADLLANLQHPGSKSKEKPVISKPKKQKKRTVNGTIKTSQELFHLTPATPAEEPSEAQSNAVRLYYRMLLDTGATLPMLYKEDFAALGINMQTYAAASTMQITTANGSRQTAVYELHVSVCDTRTAQSLVDEDEPVWPDAHPSLGGILPVAQIVGAGGREAGFPYAKSMDDRVIDIAEKAEGKKTLRLSGILPLKTCYMQSTPGLGAVWLGEDRRDVLGAQRMPGQMRWEAGSTKIFDPGHPRVNWHQLERVNGGNPSLVRIAHEVTDIDGERVVRLTDFEEEGWHGRSRTAIIDRDGKRLVYDIGPRQLKKTKIAVGA
ncbi:hypothetical protein ACHAQH_002026 [Verticillium albo-atrum]